MPKQNTIRCRIDDKLLSRFESALDREGLTKTQVLINAVHDFVTKSESRKDVSKMENVKAIFDNGGGLQLILGDYTHHYDDMEQAAEDYKEYIKTGSTDGWDGHQPELMNQEVTAEDIRNGSAHVMSTSDIQEAVKDPYFTTGWENEREFINALK